MWAMRRNQGERRFRLAPEGSRATTTIARPCRATYKQEYYALNRQRYIEAAVQRRTALAAERAAYLIEFFATHPCVECGEADPVVLEFDHLGDRSFNIAKGLRDRSWPALLDEIAKCDVVCANCHRRRTAIRGGFARATMAGAAEIL